MLTLTERFVADIEGLSDLPSLSPVLAHLIATLGREDASVAEVAAIIRQDPVIAARVLRSATSAAYIGRSPVSSIRDALLRLGLARIRRLALVASLYDAVPVRGTRADRELFWQHSLGVAHGSEIIARYAVGSPEDLDPESVFLAGLLHDLGLLVLESHYPKESSAVKRYRHSERAALPGRARGLADRSRRAGGAARLALDDAGFDRVRHPCSPSLRPGATGAPMERGHHSPGGSPREPGTDRRPQRRLRRVLRRRGHGDSGAVPRRGGPDHRGDPHRKPQGRHGPQRLERLSPLARREIGRCMLPAHESIERSRSRRRADPSLRHHHAPVPRPEPGRRARQLRDRARGRSAG